MPESDSHEAGQRDCWPAGSPTGQSIDSQYNVVLIDYAVVLSLYWSGAAVELSPRQEAPRAVLSQGNRAIQRVFSYIQ